MSHTQEIGEENVTRTLNAACDGDRQAAEDLIPLVYAELGELAAWRLRQEAEAHTLQATALKSCLKSCLPKKLPGTL